MVAEDCRQSAGSGGAGGALAWWQTGGGGCVSADRWALVAVKSAREVRTILHAFDLPFAGLEEPDRHALRTGGCRCDLTTATVFIWLVFNH
jgi:hypothetical protein